MTNDLSPVMQRAHETLNLLTHLWDRLFKSMKPSAVSECVDMWCRLRGICIDRSLHCSSPAKDSSSY